MGAKLKVLYKDVKVRVSELKAVIEETQGSNWTVVL